MNYFTADLHLGTDEILLRENRPFANINEFSNFCLNQWNKILMEKDILWILGDFFNYNKNSKLTNNELINTLSFITKLNCKTLKSCLAINLAFLDFFALIMDYMM